MGKADASGEETSMSTLRTAGVRDQACEERFAEITPGRAISQQGPAATCKDLLTKLRLKEAGGFWSGA